MLIGKIGFLSIIKRGFDITGDEIMFEIEILLFILLSRQYVSPFRSKIRYQDFG